MAVVTAGIVFGMSATVVTPPIAAERVPLGKSSLRRSPGSLMWTWRSTHPGRINASPWSICSSPRRTFLIAAIRPVSSIPMLKGSSRPRKNTRPLMTRTRRLQGPARDGTAGLGFREDLGLELVDPGRGVEPRVGQEARFHARLGQEFGCLPGVLDRDLREKEPAVRTLGHAQAIHADVDGLREVFRLLHLISWGGVRMLTSTVTRSSSSGVKREKRGSSAAPSAPFSIDLTREKNGWG